MPERKLYYGWVIVFACFLIFFVVIGVSISPSSLFIVPVTAYFGFSRGDFAITITLTTIVSMVIQLFYGVFYRVFGIRKLISIGILGAPLAFLIYYQSNSMLGFYLGSILIGMSLALASITSISILLTNWFTKRQGLLLGIIASGSGFGGSLFSLLIGNQIAENGFKSAYLLSAILLAIVTLPIILLIRSHPKHKPQNNQPQHTTNSEKLTEPTEALPVLSIGEFFGNSANLLGMLAVFCIGVSIHTVLATAPAYLVEKGFDTVFGASITAGAFFSLAIAKIVIGLIHDRVGIKISLIFNITAFIISVILLIVAANRRLVWGFAIFNGMAVSTNAVLIPLFVRDLLGSENYSRYLGVFIANLSAGIGLGAPIVNYVFDLTGTYTWILGVFGGVGMLALIFALLSLRRAAG